MLAVLCLVGAMAAGQPEGPPAVEEKIFTPETSVLFALADVQTLPPDIQPYIRYLAVYNEPKDRRKILAQISSFVCNSLGTKKKMYIPQFVGGTDETVIRINIADYNWKPEVWDKLAREGSGPRPFPEPYFHLRVARKVEVEFAPVVEKKLVKRTVTKNIVAGYYSNGQPYYRQQQVEEEVEEEVELKVPVKQTNKNEVQASAAWINADAVVKLANLTKSESPILRADWFIVNAMLPPLYYDFLNLGKTREDFEKFSFADEKTSEKANALDAAVVVYSEVTRNNRRMRRSPTLRNGYYWATFDLLSSTKGNKATVKPTEFKFDAQEIISSLPNGLQAYWLSNGNKERQDEAPINIAKDNTAVDRVVRTGRSCVICHVDGIRPINDEIREGTKPDGHNSSVQIIIGDKKDAYQTDDLFGSDLQKQITLDQQKYADAVAASSGFKVVENAKHFAEIYDHYVENLITKEVIARDCGISMTELDKYLQMAKDNVLNGLTKRQPRVVRRDQFEESFADFMLIVTANKLKPGTVPRVVIPLK